MCLISTSLSQLEYVQLQSVPQMLQCEEPPEENLLHLVTGVDIIVADTSSKEWSENPELQFLKKGDGGFDSQVLALAWQQLHRRKYVPGLTLNSCFSRDRLEEGEDRK